MSLDIRAPAVVIHLVRPGEDGAEILLLRRSDTLAGIWMAAAGRVEAGEKGWEAAIREAAEETGLVPHTLYAVDQVEQFYNIARDRVIVLPVFLGLVERDAEVILNDEHDAWEWLSFDDAIERIEFGGQRQILRFIRAEFIERAPSPWLKVDLSRSTL
jgi:dATP pyrophosphohydrolase